MTSETKTGVVQREPLVKRGQAAPRYEDDELVRLDSFLASFDLQEDEQVNAIWSTRRRIALAPHSLDYPGSLDAPPVS